MAPSKNSSGTRTAPASGPVVAALYARVSTHNGQDVQVQLDDLRADALRRHWQAVEYTDEGVSGSRERRPARDRLMADVRSGRIQAVMVWRFDRFARSVRHLLDALEEFRVCNVEFVSLNEAIDTSTPLGKMVFTVCASVAELEAQIIRERVIAGVRRAQRQGKHCGRPRRDVPIEASLALLREGRSLREVAKLVRVDRNTLRDRLREDGRWPFECARVENPSDSEAPRVG